MSWNTGKFTVVDVETTGLKSEEDRVIEVGIVHFDAGQVTEKYGQLIHPGCSIPEEVVKLTGIKDADVQGKPAFGEVAAEILSHLSRGPIVGYNLSFDKGFLSAELGRENLAWPDAPELDPLVFARQRHKGKGSKKLGAVAARLNISLENAHRAVDDAEATGHILIAFASQLPEELSDLVTLQAQWKQLQDQEMAMWRRNRGGGDVLSAATPVSVQQEDGIRALGPAFLYGEDTDPLRALYASLPDVGSSRRD